MTNDWIPSIEECNKAYESKCDYPYSDAGIEAIRALIAERYARAAQSAPPRAEAAPRGTPFDVEAVVHAVDKKWSTRQQLLDALRTALTEQLAAPRAPEPSHLIDSLTELETEVKPRLSECMRVAREAVERAGFVYPANPREVAREAAKVVYELFTSEHLPTCGWFQWPDGRVGQDGECRCPEPRAPAPSDVSADEVERIARGIHKAHGSVCSMTCGWDELGPQCRDGYLASASYALSLRSAAEKVPSLGECYGAYTNAWVGVRPQGMSVGPFTDAERAGIAAVRALFARDESEDGHG